MTGSNADNNNGTVLARTKGKTRLTAFRPRKDAKYGNRVVDESKFLGSFYSQNVDPTTGERRLYVRLSASNSIPTGRPDKPFDTTWGRIVCFGALAAQLVQHIVQSESGRFQTITAHGTHEVVENIDANGKRHINNNWVVYGYEFGNQFYTTKKGVLSVGPINARNLEEAARDGDELFAQMEQEFGGGHRLDWGNGDRDSREVARKDPAVYEPHYVDSIADMEEAPRLSLEKNPREPQRPDLRHMHPDRYSK